MYVSNNGLSNHDNDLLLLLFLFDCFDFDLSTGSTPFKSILFINHHCFIMQPPPIYQLYILLALVVCHIVGDHGTTAFSLFTICNQTLGSKGDTT